MAGKRGKFTPDPQTPEELLQEQISELKEQNRILRQLQPTTLQTIDTDNYIDPVQGEISIHWPGTHREAVAEDPIQYYHMGDDLTPEGWKGVGALPGVGVASALMSVAWRNREASLFSPAHTQDDNVASEPKDYGSIVDMHYYYTDSDLFHISAEQRPCVRVTGFPGSNYEYIVWASCAWNSSLAPYGPTSLERKIDVRWRPEGGGNAFLISTNEGDTSFYEFFVALLADFPGGVIDIKGAWRDGHVSPGTDNDKQVQGSVTVATMGYNLSAGPDWAYRGYTTGTDYMEITPFVTFWGGAAPDRFVRSWKMTVLAIPVGSSTEGYITLT
jgi:hypothetical protein